MGEIVWHPPRNPCPSCGQVWGEGCNDPHHNVGHRPKPQHYLVRLTAKEAVVARLGLAAGQPHFTAGERATAIALEQKLTQAQPIGEPR